VVKTAVCGAVVLDRHPLWLDALKGVLERSGISSVRKVTDPAAALEVIARDEPALLVADPEAQGGEIDGLECMRRAGERHSSLRMIAFSDSNEPQRIEAAFAIGAHAYVLKTACADDVAVAIRQAFEYSIYLPSTGVGVGCAAAAPAVADAAASELTRREIEILRLVAEGHPNVKVARMLWVTEQTVKFHLCNVYRKLGVANRTEASRWAQLHGLLDHDVPTQVAQIHARWSRRSRFEPIRIGAPTDLQRDRSRGRFASRR